ncbi:MAG: hypothetical protein ACXWUV_07650 [Allosphingosinicella sp.]
MNAIAATAAEAFERYHRAFAEDLLIQKGWHRQKADGRQLACGLGVLGDQVYSPGDCPAAVMPRWLARMVPWFFDLMAFEDAKQWGLDFYAELKRLDGKVPFSVVYDWHGNVVTPLAIEVSPARKRDPEPHRKLQALHLRALAGDRAPREEWRASLADADAYANAYANANAYAYAVRQERMKRLAFGMVDCLKRVSA